MSAALAASSRLDCAARRSMFKPETSAVATVFRSGFRFRLFLDLFRLLRLRALFLTAPFSIH